MRGKSKGATRDLNRVHRHKLALDCCSFAFVDFPVREDILSSNHSTHHLQVDYKRVLRFPPVAHMSVHHRRVVDWYRFAFARPMADTSLVTIHSTRRR